MTGGSPDDWRVKLTLHYDGAGFHGWQVQPEQRTVQREVEAVLEQLTGSAVRLIAAGRTDTGVHATGQVASGLVPARWTPAGLRRAMNALLPPDIWISAAVAVPLEFHARYDATARSYVYRLGTEDVARSPFHRRWCWPVGRALAPNSLARAAACWTGEHSFGAFAKAGQPERGERCTVYQAAWREWPGVGYVFRVTANRFLHHMVRYMVGTMVDVAAGVRPIDDIAGLLGGAAGLRTSVPAPPRGLFLSRVHYETNEWDGEEPDDEVLPGYGGPDRDPGRG